MRIKDPIHYRDYSRRCLQPNKPIMKEKEKQLTKELTAIRKRVKAGKATPEDIERLKEIQAEFIDLYQQIRTKQQTK